MVDQNHIAEKPTRVWHLQRMIFSEAFMLPEGLGIRPLPKPVDTQKYLWLYNSVGREWNWLDRSLMPPEHLREILNRPATEVYEWIYNGQSAGMLELNRQPHGTEIVYFGLLPALTGKGLGKVFFTAAMSMASQNHPPCIFLQTCDLDHPAALTFYQNFGFEVTRTETEMRRYLTTSSSL